MREKGRLRELYRRPLFECVANRLCLRNFSRNVRLIIACVCCLYNILYMLRNVTLRSNYCEMAKIHNLQWQEGKEKKVDELGRERDSRRGQ